MNIKFNESVLNRAASILAIKSESLKKLIIKYNKFYINTPKSFINKDLITINYNKFKIKVFIKTGEIEIIIAEKNINSDWNTFTLKELVKDSLLKDKLLITDFFDFYKTYTLKDNKEFNLYLIININSKKEIIKIFRKDIFHSNFKHYPNSIILQQLKNSYEIYLDNNYSYFDDSYSEKNDSLIFESNSKGIYKSEVINKFKIKYDINTCSIGSLNHFYEIINY